MRDDLIADRDASHLTSSKGSNPVERTGRTHGLRCSSVSSRIESHRLQVDAMTLAIGENKLGYKIEAVLRGEAARRLA
jgi:hypothetical protein